MWWSGNKFLFHYLVVIVLVNVNKKVFSQLGSREWPDNSESEVDGKKDLVQPNEKHYDGIPKFLVEPHPFYYVNKTHPALIICVAEPVSHVNIFCADKQFSYMNTERSESGLIVIKMNHLNQPDSKGNRWKFSLEVKYKDVLEWFSEYKCYCEAWNQITMINKDKKVHSSAALIQESYFQNDFKTTPKSQELREGNKLELQCTPPESKPNSKVTWLKNDELITQSNFPLIIIDESKRLIIEQVLKSDSGNYTCVAQSQGVVKKSKPAVIIITMKYNWSPWAKWNTCPEICKMETKCQNEICSSSHRQRIRYCLNEEIKVEDKHCKGESNEKESCDKACEKEESKWNSWSFWTTICFPNCSQTRVRRCEFGNCFGPKQQSRNCSQIICQRADPSLILESQSTTMYLGLFITISILFIIILIILCLITQKGYISLLPRRGMVFSNHNNGMTKIYTNKSSKNSEKFLLNNDQKSTIVTIKNHNAQDLVATSLLSEIPNNYSPVYEMHSNNNRDQVLPAIYSDYPMISKSQYTYPSTAPLLNSILSPERSYNETSEEDQKANLSSPLYQELSIGRGSCGLLSNYLPPDMELDTIAWGTITTAGGRLCLPQSGISLTIPRGAIHHGNSEEMFLAVCRDHTNIPVIDMMEMLLSPVILCGPPQIQLLKSVILTIPHCANIQCSDWNIRVLSARFQNSQIPPLWKELSTIRPVNRSDSNIYAQLDSTSAHLIIDQLQMICITGCLSPLSDSSVSIRLRILAFSLPLSSELDHIIRVHLIPDTKEAIENVIASELKLNGQLLDNSKKFTFSSSGGDIALCLDDLSLGWRCHSSNKMQTFSYSFIWRLNHSQNQEIHFLLEHVDPTRTGFSCNITIQQIDLPQNQVIVRVIKERSPNNRSIIPISLDSRSNNREFSQAYLDPLQTVFRLSFTTRQQLWPLLDPSWQTLANHMLLNGNLNYFSEKMSPSDALLDLWEARCRDEGAIADLINILRVIGRNDCAMIVEQDILKQC
uniref:Netrin receptor UNC5 n=1 Tax=Dugesia japonica TaxID=6161 RepID=E1CHK7_DUGJA|nr:uncoordinated 5 [Dugesia japonica]